MTYAELVTALRHGGRVTLPSGAISLTATLYVRSGTVLEGQGPGTVLSATGDFPCITVIDTDDTAAESVVIRDLRLTRTNSSEDTDSHGVLVCGNHVLVDRVVFVDHYTGVTVSPSPAAASGRVTVSRCVFRRVDAGTTYRHVVAQNADVVVVDGCDVENSAEEGDLYSAGDGTRLVVDGASTWASVARMFKVTNAAAASTTAVHANYNADQANAFPGAFTNPGVPRNVTVTFDASWDGGDVTVVGTDAMGNAQSEVIANSAGSTVAGAKIFATVTSASKQTVGAAAAPASIGTGVILGVAADVQDNFGLLQMDGAAEAVTVSAANNSFAPTTAPNGARDYVVLLNVAP